MSDVQSTGSTDLYLPDRRRWTREEFERAGQTGLFRRDERLELVEGDIVEKMTPQSSPHATAVRLVEEALRRWFSQGHDVRVQLPLALDGFNEPEPDAAVVVGSIRDYADGHPTTAVLVVEIAETSLRYDRSTKGALYARAGIPEYWIVNLAERVLEVLREPGAMAEQPLGHHYRSSSRLQASDVVQPLLGVGEPVAVSELLP